VNRFFGLDDSLRSTQRLLDIANVSTNRNDNLNHVQPSSKVDKKESNRRPSVSAFKLFEPLMDTKKHEFQCRPTWSIIRVY
jgi:hypothetical protein